MSGYVVSIAGRTVEPAEGWSLSWIDRDRGIARLTGPEQSLLAVVEGAATRWTVTLRGRRVPARVTTARERLLADAERTTAVHGGPVDIAATLPGLVVAVEAVEGAQVAEGDPLLTIEAMKMQNEVRASRSGRIVRIAVRVGETVSAGQLLARIE